MYILQAFIQTAAKIHDNIKNKVLNVDNEACGIKLGISAPSGGYGSGQHGTSARGGQGGCC